MAMFSFTVSASLVYLSALANVVCLFTPYPPDPSSAHDFYSFSRAGDIDLKRALRSLFHGTNF